MSQNELTAKTHRPGYTACYNAIMGAKLPQSVKYQPFTVCFDREKLDEIRDYYGADLYRECLQDAEKAAYSKYYKLATTPCGDWHPGKDFSGLEEATAEWEALSAELYKA